MTAFPPRIIALRPGIRHYAWGERPRPERVPYIASLLGVVPQSPDPWAELWLGAHPDLPSMAPAEHGECPLDSLIRRHPREILGHNPQADGSSPPTLPFLLKILSCERPLSIQAHPDRNRAKRLHERDPEHYPDASHKPEIAIALTTFEALCGFRDESAIRADLQRIPPFREIAAAADRSPPEQWIKNAYGCLFALATATVRRLTAAAVRCLEKADSRCRRDEWFLRLATLHPGDRGVLSVYFFNHIRLDPGEAVFIGPNEPHAYLHGVIIECMANSNNVVRGGLTTKFIDVPVLLDMLTYRAGMPPLLPGLPTGDGLLRYLPPVPEFQVGIFRGKQPLALRKAGFSGPAIALILAGDATIAGAGRHEPISAPRGTAWLIPALTDATFALVRGEGSIVLASPHPEACA